MKTINFKLNDQEALLVGELPKSRLMHLIQLEEDLNQSYVDLKREEIVLHGSIYEELLMKKVQENNPLMFDYTENIGVDTSLLFLKKSPHK